MRRLTCYLRLWLNRTLKRKSPGIRDRLKPQAHARALEEARFLLAQGAWVRDLLPGEVPKEEPEIGAQPIRAGKAETGESQLFDSGAGASSAAGGGADGS